MNDRIEALHRLMQTHRSRWQRLQILEALGWVASGVTAYFLAAVVLDNVAHLPTLGRLLAAGGLVIVAGWLARRFISRWQQRHVSEDQVALAIERRTPGGVQNRLINTLQIGREAQGSDAAISDALAQENWRHLEERPLPGATAARPAATWLLLAAALLAIAVGGWLWQPARFATSAKRILLPFAAIDPVFRTVLVVEPGDAEAVGEVTIRVRIRGERPAELAVMLAGAEGNSTQTVPVPDAGPVEYTVRNIESSFSYAVHGGDFTSAFYRIEVPTPARLALVRTTYHYPAYTRMADKTIDGGGDLEAVAGASAKLVFVLDHPADEATLIVRGKTKGDTRSASAAGKATASKESTKQASERTSNLDAQGPKEFLGQLLLDDVTEYAIETHKAGRPACRSPWHTVRVVADEPPRLELSGLPASGEMSIDAPLPVTVKATDDFGLVRVGLFVRRAAREALPKAGGSAAAADAPASGADKKPAASSPTASSSAADAQGWTMIGDWACDGNIKFEKASDIASATVGAVEGERLEMVARAIDNYPDRANRWTSGAVHTVLVVGEGAQLQIAYEQILRSEAELASFAAAEQSLFAETDKWVRKLDGDAKDAGKTPELKEIVAAGAKLSAEHDKLRQAAGLSAREMVPQAGNLRLSLGMLADTEMVRSIRVLDSLATRDDVAACRTALADARATQQRTLQSLQQVQEQYVRFRQEWELAHMTPFVRMLADRQAALAEASSRKAGAGTDAPAENQTAGDAAALVRKTIARRQEKIAELCGLASTAFSGLAERVAESESQLSEAFGETSEGLVADELKQPMNAAKEAVATGQWANAAKAQKDAATRLDDLYKRLHEAQVEAARRVLAGADDRAESDLEAQAAIKRLKAGSAEDLLDTPDGLKLEDVVHLAEVTQAKDQDKDKKPFVENYLLPNSAIPGLNTPDKGIRQQFDILKLATSPGSTPSFPKQSDREGNRVNPHIQEQFEDLVGDLLKEEDEMKENYETYNINAAFNINEPGEIGKQGGDLNSTAAAAATGNQKPPTTNVGGASRVGRQGARAHGAAVGDESVNRRGRDKVQEGQERSPDQAGSVKETMSNDPQKDTSTGIGGRKVESDDAHFSLSDSGQWNDETIDRMQKPKDKQSIVERQGGKLDPKIAEMLRDHASKQEQIIERLKSIRKELKNLYLPTDHLDELIAQAQAQTSSLHERPTPEMYRLQQQTLAQIRGALTVFHQAHSGFQASVPRDQAVRGRVVDDPTRTVPPGYEEAVKSYYQRLTTQ